MSGDPDRFPVSSGAGRLRPPGATAELVAGRTRWMALAAFAAFAGIGVLRENPSLVAAAAAAAAAVIAAGLLVHGLKPQLLFAAVATAGIAVEGNGLSSNVGWLAVCLLAGWCVLVAGRDAGLIYWTAAVVLFTVEWIWVRPDPGWGAWIAGTTFTVVFSLLIVHQIDLVAQLRAAQAGLAEQARTQERNRIARELHDILGHTLTVSLLHVQSARLAVEHDPADAARALAEAERLGRECLAEVRTTVGMLRRDADGARASEEPGTVPLPGVDGLPALVERFRSAGADVTFTVDGDTAGLPATAGLAVYRILQEALTNAAKHAPRAPTAVRLVVGAGTVTLTADSLAEPGAGTGLGVISMRERAESLGGTCEAGPGGRGWLVRATLPVGARP
jgi:signal transduction histidine kinase